MGSLDVDFGKLIEPSCQAGDRLLPDKTGERLRADALGNEILQSQHAPGFQEFQRMKPLGARG
jgi:hypothetical protein